MSEGQKLGITIGVFVLINLAMAGFLYTQLKYVGWGPLKDDESLAGKVDRLNAKLKKAKAAQLKIPQAKDKLEMLKNDSVLALQLLPTESSPDELLYFINNKARESGVILNSIKPSKPKPKYKAPDTKKKKKKKRKKKAEDLIEEWTYTMSLEGTYDQIGKFVNKMENFEIRSGSGRIENRFFAVKTIKVKAGKGGLIEGETHRCDLVMMTFRYLGE